MTTVQADRLDAGGLLYERYKKVLWAYFYNCTREKEVSGDLVQVTFEKVIKYRKNYRGEGTFKAWLFSIARNVVKDQWSKNAKHLSKSLEEEQHNLADKNLTSDQEIMRREREALYKSAMASLSHDKRELLSMVKLNGMKYKQASVIYDVPESTLKVKVFRIMKELKQYVKEAQSNRHY